MIVESRKQAVSIRMSAADVRKVKRLAQRLGAVDSDVIRFAVKTMLARLAPLNDTEVRGRNLVPVFVESGGELLRFFDLDAGRLEAIINDGAEPAKRVDRDDIKLLALTGGETPYAALKLSELNHDERRGSRSQALSVSLRDYLYAKYVFRDSNGGAAAEREDVLHLAATGTEQDGSRT